MITIKKSASSEFDQNTSLLCHCVGEVPGGWIEASWRCSRERGGAEGWEGGDRGGELRAAVWRKAVQLCSRRREGGRPSGEVHTRSPNFGVRMHGEAGRDITI